MVPSRPPVCGKSSRGLCYRNPIKEKEEKKEEEEEKEESVTGRSVPMLPRRATRCNRIQPFRSPPAADSCRRPISLCAGVN